MEEFIFPFFFFLVERENLQMKGLVFGGKGGGVLLSQKEVVS